MYIIGTLPPPSMPLKSMIFFFKVYFVNDRLCCMCDDYPKPGLFYLFKNTLVSTLASFQSHPSLSDCGSPEEPPID